MQGLPGRCTTRSRWGFRKIPHCHIVVMLLYDMSAILDITILPVFLPADSSPRTVRFAKSKFGRSQARRSGNKRGQDVRPACACCSGRPWSADAAGNIPTFDACRASWASGRLNRRDNRLPAQYAVVASRYSCPFRTGAGEARRSFDHLPRRRRKHSDTHCVPRDRLLRWSSRTLPPSGHCRRLHVRLAAARQGYVSMAKDIKRDSSREPDGLSGSWNWFGDRALTLSRFDLLRP